MYIKITISLVCLKMTTILDSKGNFQLGMIPILRKNSFIKAFCANYQERNGSYNKNMALTITTAADLISHNLANWFWNEDIWLPPNVTWTDLENGYVKF